MDKAKLVVTVHGDQLRLGARSTTTRVYAIAFPTLGLLMLALALMPGSASHAGSWLGAVVCIALGLACWLLRSELVVDRAARDVWAQRLCFHLTARRKHSIRNAQRITVGRAASASGANGAAYHLVFTEDGEQRVVLWSSTDADQARGVAERIATFLGLPLHSTDDIGAEGIEPAQEKPDAPDVVAPAFVDGARGQSPSRIVCRSAAAQTTVDLPRVGWRPKLRRQFCFRLVLALVSSVLAVWLSLYLDDDSSSQIPMKAIAPYLCVVVVVLANWPIVNLAARREQVILSADELKFVQRGVWRRRVWRAAYSEIKEVIETDAEYELVQLGVAEHMVLVRTVSGPIWIGGGLTDDERRWLLGVLCAAVQDSAAAPLQCQA